MSRHKLKVLCFSIVLLVLQTSGMTHAGIPAEGSYMTDLGMAEIRHEKGLFRIVFEEVFDFEIEGSGDDDVAFLSGGDRIPCDYLLMTQGFFAFVAAGDTLYFHPADNWDEPGDQGFREDENQGALPDEEDGSGKRSRGSENDEADHGMVPDTPPAAGERFGDEYMGFDFSAPEGWKKSAQSEGSFTLASARGNGTILVSTHIMNSVEELRKSIQGGISLPQAGTELALEGELRRFGKDGVASKLRGTFQGAPVVAYNVALLSPHGGGATIMAWSGPGEYSDDLEEAARAIAAGISFRKPTEHPEVAIWKRRLPGSRLSYIESDFTAGMPTDGYSTGSSYNIERHLDLCGDGSFHFKENTDYSVDAGSAGNAGGSDSDDHVGRWLIFRFGGYTVLELRYSSGGVGAIVLGRSDGQVLLDGEEWSIGGSPVCR